MSEPRQCVPQAAQHGRPDEEGEARPRPPEGRPQGLGGRPPGQDARDQRRAQGRGEGGRRHEVRLVEHDPAAGLLQEAQGRQPLLPLRLGQRRLQDGVQGGRGLRRRRGRLDGHGERPVGGGGARQLGAARRPRAEGAVGQPRRRRRGGRARQRQDGGAARPLQDRRRHRHAPGDLQGRDVQGAALHLHRPGAGGGAHGDGLRRELLVAAGDGRGALLLRQAEEHLPHSWPPVDDRGARQGARRSRRVPGACRARCLLP